MKAKLIGIGAAGNKAAIHAINQGVFDRKDVLLLNTTQKDMKDEFNDINIVFGDNRGGCGKERDMAKGLAMEALRADLFKLDSFPDPQDEAIIIVSSSEGGTGCGASTIVAKYCKQVLKMNVHMFVFTGFEQDARGIQNTVEYFQELSDEYTVQAISNKKFLDGIRSKQDAERAANQEFTQRMAVLLGQDLVESDQNIDDTDLYKLSTTPGFMTIEKAKIASIKNTEDLYKELRKMLDYSKSLEFKPTAKRIGVIFGLVPAAQNMDLNTDVLRERLGEPYEFFTHIQDAEPGKEFIEFIASGIKMPIDEVNKAYQTYLERTSKVDKSKDSFFDEASSMTINKEDGMFNFDKTGPQNISKADKDAFFASSKPVVKPRVTVSAKDDFFNQTTEKVTVSPTIEVPEEPAKPKRVIITSNGITKDY